MPLKRCLKHEIAFARLCQPSCPPLFKRTSSPDILHTVISSAVAHEGLGWKRSNSYVI